MKSNIGLIGLAVMGQNLVLNMRDHGFKVSVYNRTYQKTADFISNLPVNQKGIQGFEKLDDFIDSLESPKKVMLMVKAGNVVDQYIEKLIPMLSPGDIIIDGGNSNYQDSSRRADALKEQGLIFMGTGVSGGEEGARRGPSIMPGGNKDGWKHVKPIFQAISAKTPEGEACCDWVGPQGAGHFVKMVHNGIEYGDMQLIAETYDLLLRGMDQSHKKMADLFDSWNKGDLSSYLIEISADILKFKDEKGDYLVEKILDKAGQKGTGKWTGMSGLEFGIPITLITESVFARAISALKADRIQADSVLNKAITPPDAKVDSSLIADIESALLSAKIISYAQGMMLIKEASKEFNWNINLGDVALMWREGCIIRSVFLGEIKRAYTENPELSNLILDDYFVNKLKDGVPKLRKIVARAVTAGIPMPGFTSALTFYDSIRTKRLPANMLQAMRDYFGAHTYQRIDDPDGGYHHTNWTGTGGNVASTTYDA